MPFSLLVLLGQTLLLWMLVVVLYRAKNRITLIPLYAYIAVLTVLTQNFSDLGFAVVVGDWFLHIASFSFFTTLMFGTLYLYLLQGPRAGRSAFWIILFSTSLYVFLVFVLGYQTDTTQWVRLDDARAISNFWSVFAIVIDVIFLGIGWESLGKVRNIPLVARLFLIVFGILLVDTAIFSTGAFGGQDFYLSMLKGNVVVRLILALVGAPILAIFLRAEGFDEATRKKPKSIWEILNFRSDLETKIQTLERMIEKQKDLEQGLKESREAYALAIEGVGAGIWNWNAEKDVVEWSAKFHTLLGYPSGKLKKTLAGFKSLVHPEDVAEVNARIERCFSSGNPFETEARLKEYGDGYRWFQLNGAIQRDKKNQPVLMVGSAIDIDERKRIGLELTKKVAELEKLNSFMLGREKRMIELKERLAQYEPLKGA